MKNFKFFLEAVEHPITRIKEVAEKYGFKYESPYVDKMPNPNVVKYGGSTYPTLMSGNVKIALDTADLYYHNNYVRIGDPTEYKKNRITVAAIIVDESERGKGLASQVMKNFQLLANELKMKIVGEPVQMKEFKGKKSLTTKQLINWYKKLGWKQKEDGNDRILIYEPQ